MNSNKVVLSLFPGAGLLDMGFEAAGFCIIRGPDLLWGSDIKKWDARALEGRVDGVIGGVPCQAFSTATRKADRKKHDNLWPEFWRVVNEVDAKWCLAENVLGAVSYSADLFCAEHIKIYPTFDEIICSDFGSVQARKRMILFAGHPDVTQEFWKILKRDGAQWGNEWREQIGRETQVDYRYRTIIGDGTNAKSTQSAKYSTILGDSMEPRNSGTGKPYRYIKGDDLLDAFDLPRDWDVDPKNMVRFSRAIKARMITQGVPVAAAYALGKSVAKALELLNEMV